MKRIASVLIITLCLCTILLLPACSDRSSYFVLQNAEEIGDISMGAFPVNIGGTWKLCRTDGKQVGKESFSSLKNFGENLLLFSRNEHFGLIDYGGKILFEIPGVYLGMLYCGTQEFAPYCLLFQTRDGIRVYNYLTENTSPALPMLLLPNDSPDAADFYARCPYEGLYLERKSNRILSYLTDDFLQTKVFFQGFSDYIHCIRSESAFIRLKDASKVDLSDGIYEKVPYAQNLTLQDIFYRYATEEDGSLSLKIRGDTTLNLSNAPKNAPAVQFASDRFIVAGNMLYDLFFNPIRPLFLRYLTKIKSFGKTYLFDRNYRVLYDTEFNAVSEHCVGSVEYLGETYLLTKSGILGNALRTVVTANGTISAEAKDDVLAITVFTTQGRRTDLYDFNFEKIAENSSLNDYFYYDGKFYYFQNTRDGYRILKDRDGRDYFTCKNSRRDGSLVLGYDDSSRLTSAIDLKSGVGLSPELMNSLRTSNLQKEPDLYATADDILLVMQFDQVDGCNMYSVKHKRFLFTDRFTSLMHFIPHRQICLVLQGQSYISYSVAGSAAKKIDTLDTLLYTQSAVLANVFTENYSGRSVFFLSDGHFSRPTTYSIENTAGNFAVIREGDRLAFLGGSGNLKVPLRLLSVSVYPEYRLIYMKENDSYGTLYTDNLETLADSLLNAPILIRHRGNAFLKAQMKSGKSFLLCAGAYSSV